MGAWFLLVFFCLVWVFFCVVFFLFGWLVFHIFIILASGLGPPIMCH